VWHSIAVIVTAYCLSGVTASGTHVAPGTVAVDPREIPLGSTLRTPGYGVGRALDTGALVRGAHIDVWMRSCSHARQFGVRRLVVRVLGR
jgi:3D (Asp-Asp-Asp) domain-containing protein